MSTIESAIASLVESYFPRLADAAAMIDLAAVRTYVRILDDARRRGAAVYLCGNGGSGSTASHVVCDLNKGTAGPGAPRFRAVSLADNVATMLAYANDSCYEDIFIEQLRGVLKAGDVVIGISGSGNSPNVVRAVVYAKTVGAVTIGLTGYDGGLLRSACDLSVHVPVHDMQIAEDLHLAVNHLAMQELRRLSADSPR